MTTLTVRLRGRIITVDALPTGIPGLMAHATGSGAPGWMLTHARSGNGVAYFPEGTDPEVLLACAQELAPVADWTLPAPDLLASVDRCQVRAIADRWGAVDRGVRTDCLDDLPAVTS